jgi:hypothetical protein
VNRQVAVGILLTSMGLATLLLPIVPALPFFFSCAAIYGFGCGGFDVAKLVWIVEMWTNNPAPQIQVLFGCFALGSFVSPLLTYSFLPQEDGDKMAFGVAENFAPKFSSPNPDPKKSESLLYIPFLIGGLLLILGGFLLLVLYCVQKYKPPTTSNVAEPSGETGGSESPSSKKSGKDLVLIILSAVAMGLYYGCQMSTTQFLPTFSHFIELKLSNKDGALLLSGLTGAFTAGRLCGIVLILKIKPKILLLGNFLLVIIANTLLLFFGEKSITVLWTSVTLVGFGFSTVFPSFYGYMEKHLTSKFTAAVNIACGLVSTFLPILIGEYIERFPTVLVYTNYVCLGTSALTLLVIYRTIARGSGDGRN